MVMKKLLFVFALLGGVLTCLAQPQLHYSRAKISLDASAHSIQKLSALGLATDHGEYKKNTFFVADFSDIEIAKAQQAGFRVEIIVPDVSSYYSNQQVNKTARTTSVSCNLPPVSDPSHFHLGTYGGFFTYAEMLTILDSMRLLYPGLISMRQPIDTFHSILDSPIYWIRISNNPDVDQPAKPQALYTALHHAREPGALSAVIYYLWYLLENYATDPHIKALIDNEELYFVPCINPDGYLYNISTNPTGGGMWRKNRRNNLDGTYGVDLNRNYAEDWGYDDIGSSPTTSSDTYRGTGPFSEPETQAIKWFADHHDFKINLNYHTYNNDIIYPWGYIGSYQTIDSSLFFSYGSLLTSGSHYRYGTTNQTLDYVANGDSDDWMYGDTTDKPKVFAMTPEVGLGEYGFYPPATNILPDCENNLLSNIDVASLLLPYATITSSDARILISATGAVHYNLKRLGLKDNDTFTVSIASLDTRLTLPSTPKVYTNLALLQQVADSFIYSIDTSTPSGQLLSYAFTINNNYYTVKDTVSFFYGKYYTVTNPATSSLADWVNTGWGVCSTTYFTPPASLKSSIGCVGNYLDNEDITLTTASALDLTFATHAWLQFETRWAIESNYDYVIVSASSDGGVTWSPLCGKFTKNGSTYQAYDEPIYDGQQPGWLLEQMDLGDYLGQHVLIRYELVSDPAVDYDGFYIDDVNITTIQDAPTSVTQHAASEQKMMVYPNPAADLIRVVRNCPGTPVAAGQLTDLTGRVVARFQLKTNSTEISVAELPAGVYILSVIGSSDHVPVTIIK